MQRAAHILSYHHNLPAFFAEKLRALAGADFSDTAIILPTQRLQHYIQMELSERVPACFPPHLFTIAGFARTLPTASARRIISDTEQKLIIDALLHRDDFHYLRTGMESNLAQFFGELAEQNLTDSAFAHIKSLLENDYFRDEAHLARLLEQTEELQAFYHRYLAFLSEHQLIDEQHAFQQAVVALAGKKPHAERKKHKRLWIAGFSDATATQVLLFKYLQQHPDCAFFFHADEAVLAQNEGADLAARHFGLLRKLLQQLDFDRAENVAAASENSNLAILQQAFGVESTANAQNAGNITVHGATSPLLEVKAAASLTHKMLSSGHAKAEQILIVVPDEMRYGRLIRSVFAEANIPVSDSMGLAMVRTQLGQWLRLLVDLAVHNWRVSDLISLLANPLTQAWYAQKNGAAPISELQERISQYSERHRVSSGLLHDLKLRSTRPAKTGEEELARNILQQIAPIEHLTNNLSAQTPCAIGEWANRLWRLIEAFDLEKLVLQNQNESLLQEYASLQMLYRNLQQIFRLSHILPESRTLGDFYYLLQQNVFSSQIRRDGEAHSGVQIMGLLVARSVPAKVLLILGNNEGSFPSTSHREHFYTDPFRHKLGLTTHKSLEQLQDQHFYALVAGSEEVHLFYSHQDDERPAVKSRYIQRLALLNYLTPNRVAFTEEHGLLYPGDFLTSELLSRLDNRFKISYRALQAQTAERLKIRGQFTGNRDKIFAQMSPSTIEYLLYCPYQFLLYKLNFSELEIPEEEMDSREAGEWLHRVCEHFFIGKSSHHTFDEPALNQPWRQAITEHNFEQALERLRKMSRQLAQKDRARLDYLYQMEFIGWRTFLEREIERGELDLDASQYEYRLMEKDSHMLNLDEFDVRITGRIDRVARAGDSLRVIDYKTRENWKKSEVTGGKAPQLPLYVEMLKQITSERPQWSAEYFALWNGKKLLLSDETAKNELTESWRTLSDNLRKRLIALYKNGHTMGPEEDKKHCTYCLYEGICRRQENWVFGKNEDAPVLSKFMKM